MTGLNSACEGLWVIMEEVEPNKVQKKKKLGLIWSIRLNIWKACWPMVIACL